MRFLIHELPYERPLAAGKLRYERDGRPTGAVESWRLTSAVDGYRFLRVDLDARDAPSGLSYLYHLTLGPNGRAERLAFRVWGAGRRVGGNVLLDETSVAIARNDGTADERREDGLTLPTGYLFWFPTSIGLSLLADAPAGEVTAVVLDYDRALTLHQVSAQIKRGQAETREIVRRTRAVRPLTVTWAGQWRRVWLDEYDWPVEMGRQDGLTATAVQYIRYQ